MRFVPASPHHRIVSVAFCRPLLNSPTLALTYYSYHTTHPHHTIHPHLRFEAFIMSCIIANTIVMATQSFGQADAYTMFSEMANYIFAIIFTLEAIIKIIGLGKRCVY